MANEAGQGCVNRGGAWADNYTLVSQGAPASQGGSCNKLEIYAWPFDAADVLKFNFFTASGNDLTAIGTAISIPVGGTGEACYSYTSPGDFTAFSVNSGEYLGLYCPNNANYWSSGGAGYWLKVGDYSEANSVTFILDADALDGLSADIVAAGGLSIPVAMSNYLRQMGA